MILLERLREILVHLCLDALLPIAKHSMCGKRDDGCPLGSEASLIFSDLGSGFKSSLCYH